MASSLSAGATAAIPPANPVIAYGTRTSAGTTAVYTVPAGRTFYCTGFALVCLSAATATILIDAAAIASYPLSVTGDVISISGTPVFAATAGQAVNLQASGNGFGLTVWGYLL